MIQWNKHKKLHVLRNVGKEEENKLKKMCTNIIIFHCFVSFIKLSPLSRERDVVGEKNDIFKKQQGKHEY